jgi:hypothetical protein
MTILFPTLAVAFAAICVWLTVRIINRREEKLGATHFVESRTFAPCCK